MSESGDVATPFLAILRPLLSASSCALLIRALTQSSRCGNPTSRMVPCTVGLIWAPPRTTIKCHLHSVRTKTRSECIIEKDQLPPRALLLVHKFHFSAKLSTLFYYLSIPTFIMLRQLVALLLLASASAFTGKLFFCCFMLE